MSLIRLLVAGLFALVVGLALSACSQEPAIVVDAGVPEQAAWIDAALEALPARLVVDATQRPTALAWEASLGSKSMALHEPELLRRYYVDEGQGFLFVGEGGLTDVGRRWSERLTHLREVGLDPARFHGEDLQKAERKFVKVVAEWAPTQAAGLTLSTDERSVLGALAATAPATELEAGLTFLVQKVRTNAAVLPALSERLTLLSTQAAPLLEARLRWELRLSDAFVRYVRVMGSGNLATEEREARRLLAPLGPPSAEAPGSEADAERGGAGTVEPDDDVTSTPVAVAPGVDLPPILRDRAAFISERLRLILHRVHDVASLLAVLDESRPRHPQYALLAKALARYRAVAESGGFAKDLVVRALGPGARGKGVLALQSRLAQEGVYSGSPTGAWDEATVKAVERYQEAHQQPITGRPDRRFWAELDVLVGTRIRAIDRALDTVRQSRVDDDPYFVLVNIPDFHLEVFADGQRLLRNRVVVGKPYGTVCDERTRRLSPKFATPVLSAEISQMVFAPYWLLTRAIKEQETDPERAKDPLYYEKNGFEVIEEGTSREWVRQLPSPANSLGFVKILFPNAFAVYVHDTPHKGHFDRLFRATSHGCVRLQSPRELAALLLRRDGHADPSKYDALYASWEAMAGLLQPYDEKKYRRALRDAMALETGVRLSTPVPIHLEYYTTRVGDDGVVEFLTDLYEHDKRKWTAKNAPSCVPESHVAREGQGSVEDELTALEKDSASLVKRIDRMQTKLGGLDRKDKDEAYLAKRAAGLVSFGPRALQYAGTVRAANEKLKRALERRKGDWTRELQDEAVKLKRLVDGLRKMNDGARKVCDDVEERG